MDGQARAIEALYRREYVGFRNAAATVTGDYESARDAVQEGFARALRARRQLRDPRALDAWVWRIVLRTAFEQASGKAEVPLAEFEADLVEARAEPSLRDAIGKLPPRRRLVVFLRFFGDLSYAEIAEICEISTGTVAATLAQARDALARVLEREEIES